VHRDVHPYGGLTGAKSPRTQREWIAAATYWLFETAARFEATLIVLTYPSPEQRETFAVAWHDVVDLALVRDESWRSRGTQT
jgi:hypothetical protein